MSKLFTMICFSFLWSVISDDFELTQKQRAKSHRILEFKMWKRPLRILNPLKLRADCQVGFFLLFILSYLMQTDKENKLILKIRVFKRWNLTHTFIFPRTHFSVFYFQRAFHSSWSVHKFMHRYRFIYLKVKEVTY